ncbi:Decarboxylase orsB [Exophiala dermatitidis]
MPDIMPLITLEEHFVSQAVIDYYAQQGKEHTLPQSHKKIMKVLCEVGPLRLQFMDSGRVSVQVISHRPNSIPIPPEVCRAANNELSEAIKSSPSPNRFAAFAMLPTLYPEESAAELERCVKELNFVGSLIDNTVDGRFYDDRFFWPIFAAHERLDVPVYLHASPHMPSETSPFHGNYAPQVSSFLENHGFNWHTEVALGMLRLFAAKLFDEYPHLKVLLGHMGELLPYSLDRIHRLVQRTWPTSARPRRHLMQVWHHNIYVTTSGMFSLAPMACLIHMCCADKVLYSVDYPFCSNEEGLVFMNQLRESGMINEQDFLDIAYKNAERLLGLRVPEDNQVGIAEDPTAGDGDSGLGLSPSRLRPWLSTDSSNGDPSGAFPHSPLQTVHE